MNIGSALVGMGLLALTVSGCAHGAEWKSATVAPGYVAPKTLNVMIKKTATGEDVDQATEVFAKALSEELKEKGITAKIVTSAPTAPGATIDITSWEKGNRGMRFMFGRFGAGHGEIVVHVEVAPSEGAPGAITGDLRGYVRGGMWGGDANLSAEAAGKKVAETVATGKQD